MTFKNEAEATTSERVECHPSGHVYLLDQRNILWYILNMKATWSQKPKFGYLSDPYCFYSQWLTGLFCASVFFFSFGFLEWMALIPKQGLWLPVSGDTEKVALNSKLELLQSTKSIRAPPGTLVSHRTCEWMCAGQQRLLHEWTGRTYSGDHQGWGEFRMDGVGRKRWVPVTGQR